MSKITDGWPIQVDIVLVPHFTLLSLSSAVEVLRVANRMAERTLFRWRLLSEDGQPVQASNGISLPVEGSFKEIKNCAVVMVFAGFHPQAAETEALLGFLRAQARHGAVMGGIETGPQILAAAGLLDGHSASIHWEHFEAFRQRFPEVEALPVLFTIEQRRFTSCGLMAVADLMIALIARWVSPELARTVAETIVHHQRSADGREAQRMDPVARFNIHSEVLRKAIRIMQDNLERPLSTKEIAARCGIGVRQLERRFFKSVGATPAKFYLRLRLDRARQLLHYSTSSITEIALTCGFYSPSHFSKCYREHYGVTPSGERRHGPTIGAEELIA